MAENKEGILKSFVPVMENNVHSSWTSDKYGKTYYKFTVTFEKDNVKDVGTVSSTFQKPNWETGKEYNYEKSPGGQQGQYVNFGKLKLKERSFYSRRELSSEEKHSVATMIATECAILFCTTRGLGSLNKDDDRNYALKFMKLLMDKQNDWNGGERAANALRNAIKAMAVDEFDVKTFEDVCAKFEEYFKRSEFKEKKE